jgi:hypothetical protein
MFSGLLLRLVYLKPLHILSLIVIMACNWCCENVYLVVFKKIVLSGAVKFFINKLLLVGPKLPKKLRTRAFKFFSFVAMITKGDVLYIFHALLIHCCPSRPWYKIMMQIHFKWFWFVLRDDCADNGQSRNFVCACAKIRVVRKETWGE